MINLGELTFDPDFAQVFFVQRSHGAFGRGGWIEDYSEVLQPTGIITPATEQALEMVPEGDRVVGSMMVTTATELKRSHDGGLGDPDPGTSDIVVWRGERYRVQAVWPWVDQGFWKAIIYRTQGS